MWLNVLREAATKITQQWLPILRSLEPILNIQLKRSLRDTNPGEAAPASSAQDLLVRLRADIVNNTFVPEAKLKFADLTSRYDVGIGTLREALSQLVSEGFVTSEAGKGFRVAAVSRAELAEVTEHYIEFERRALAEAMEHGDDVWEARVVACFHRLSLIEARSWQERMRRHDDWVERHREFHEALVSACSGHWLLRLRSLMFFQLERYRFLSKMNREKNAKSKGIEHRAIVEAVLARDVAKASKLLDRHVRETSESVLRLLA
jgi:GntR family carbon starvation induced transcriptional regulator